MGFDDDLPRMIARRYHASALHLLAHGLLFAVVGWVLVEVLAFRGALDVLVWLGAALVLHDLVLLPLYAALDRIVAAASRRTAARGVPVVNHVRVPAALGGLTLLVFFPLIAGESDANLRRVSGIEPTGYLERWLAFVAAAFVLSALVYAVRVNRLHRRARAHEDGPAGDGRDRARPTDRR
jgi:uncharacterized membrane protein